MKTLKNVLPKAAIIFLIVTLLCGVVYTGVVTGIAQLVFPDKANDMTEDEVREIVDKCTDGRFLGVFGEETVNVLKVNLMLDGIL